MAAERAVAEPCEAGILCGGGRCDLTAMPLPVCRSVETLLGALE